MTPANAEGHLGTNLEATFHPDSRWVLHPQVAVRPEAFGALLYHFGTRRLSFLKDPRLLEIIRTLSDHRSALAACAAAGVTAGEQRAFSAALARLAANNVLISPDRLEKVT